jgi:hypothetical protein
LYYGRQFMPQQFGWVCASLSNDQKDAQYASGANQRQVGELSDQRIVPFRQYNAHNLAVKGSAHHADTSSELTQQQAPKRVRPRFAAIEEA